MILIAIATGTAVGATSLVSRSLGSNERKKAGLAAEHAILASVLLSIIFAVLGIFLTEPITRIFTNDPLMIGMTGSYIRIILIGSFALFIPQVIQGILRGEGNTFIPMIVMIISAVLNIILDPLFIFGIGFFPEMGIEGAAYATVLARIIGGIVLIWFMFKRRNDIEINLKKFKLQMPILGEIYKIGFPAMAMQLLGSITLVGVNMILGSQ